ncbi:hypothetical protein VTH06DRAFT_2986 [Thermothelomyces fergusii]
MAPSFANFAVGLFLIASRGNTTCEFTGSCGVGAGCAKAERNRAFLPHRSSDPPFHVSHSNRHFVADKSAHPLPEGRMTERITDEQVADLVALLRTDASIDVKVQHVTAVKSCIKQQTVPETCIVPLFEALRTASSSQHSILVNAGFSALNHLFTRLSRQDPKALAREGVRILPLVVEKLGDQKEKYRQLAQQALVTLYKVAPVEVERSVRNMAMVGKNPRAKEASLHWLLQMHQEHGLQFRAYVPTLMELLEDADGTVREVAKSTVIELFRNAPGPAKSDLKKQLKNFKVRPAIESAIVKELNPTSSSTPGLPDSSPEAVEPLYVDTLRELDDIMKEMQPHFEDKETEQNWMKREESITKLRRMIAGNAVSKFHDQFLAGLRAFLDNIVKAVVSLRTSLSKEGCSLVQDIANAFGPAMDPMVEILMQTFIKLAAGTKKITASLANTTVDTIIARVTYTNRIMQHVWYACQDKNVQPRLYATGWLDTLLKKEARHKNHVEHTGGLDLIEKCIKKGLSDANPGVRTKMRATYWTFAGIWPARAEAIMSGLDATAAKLLQNDPNNPRSPKKQEGGVRPGLGLSKSTMGTSKQSLRDTVAAQRRAMTKTLPTPTAGPYSVRSHDQPAAEQSSPPSNPKPRAVTPKSIASSPKRTVPKMPPILSPSSSPSKAHEDFSLVVPNVTIGGAPPEEEQPRADHAEERQEDMDISQPTTPSKSPGPSLAGLASPVQLDRPTPGIASAVAASPVAEDAVPAPLSPSHSLVVYEDPVEREQETEPKPVTEPVLEHRPVNEDAAILQQAAQAAQRQQQEQEQDQEQQHPHHPRQDEGPYGLSIPPEKLRQNLRLLDSGIAKVQQKSLDVHGLRKLQAIIRDSVAAKSPAGSTPLLTDDRFDALVKGLFDFLESPLSHIAAGKVQDVKGQVVATINLLLKRMRASFQPHVSRSLESLVRARAAYEGRTHLVSALELLAADLAALGDASEIVLVLCRMLRAAMDGDADAAPDAGRSLSMGLHVLRKTMEQRGAGFVPSDAELDELAGLAGRCLERAETAVRMDAVHLCVALHARVGAARFWEAVRGVSEGPKNLITYYIAREQREGGAGVANS